VTAGEDGVLTPATTLDRHQYELEVEDGFEAPELDRRLWLPYYLPHWSSRAAAAARYEVGKGQLRLWVEPDQPPWCPEFDPDVRVSSVQTGLFAGPVGSMIGQHRFREGLVVREAQPNVALYTPQDGLIEICARATDERGAMVAGWMIGVEDVPEHSAEICIFEIFGRDVGAGEARIGMGLHPFGDPAIRDDFVRPTLPIDAREPHWYAAEWTIDGVRFYVDDQLVNVVGQSPAYPMQLMLGVYRFNGEAPARTAELVVERFRGSRPVAGPEARPPAFRRRPRG